MKRFILIAGSILLALLTIGMIVIFNEWNAINHPKIPLFQSPECRLLYKKEITYAQWEPFWTTQHQIFFINYDYLDGSIKPRKMVRFDPHTATFGPEETIHTVRVGKKGIILNEHELLNSLKSTIFSSYHLRSRGENKLGTKASYILTNGQELFLKDTQALLFDPNTDNVIRLPMPQQMWDIAFIETHNGLFLLGSSRDSRPTLIYNLRTKQFKSGPHLNHNHGTNFTLLKLRNNDFLVVGGDIFNETKGWFGSRRIERYDHRKKRFITVGQMTSPRMFPNLLQLDDGTVLISGGATSNTWPDVLHRVNTIELCRP